MKPHMGLMRFRKAVLMSAPVYYNDIPVGQICGRIEKPASGNEGAKLYLMTMGVLAVRVSTLPTGSS